MSTCRYCGTEIRWAKTVNGKPIPLDPDPRPDGNIILRNGIANVVALDHPGSDHRHVAHFTTCTAYRTPPGRQKTSHPKTT